MIGCAKTYLHTILQDEILPSFPITFINIYSLEHFYKTYWNTLENILFFIKLLFFLTRSREGHSLSPMKCESGTSNGLFVPSGWLPQLRNLSVQEDVFTSWLIQRLYSILVHPQETMCPGYYLIGGSPFKFLLDTQFFFVHLLGFLSSTRKKMYIVLH